MRRDPDIPPTDGHDPRTPETAAPVPGDRRWQRPRRRWWLAGAAAFVLLCGLLSGPLADRLWPQTRAQQLERQAAGALARGHLSAADGSGARELYEAAMAIDPDRLESRRGLVGVADAALARARADIAARRFDDAHALLALARELSAPRGQVDAVAGLLRAREAADAGLDGLVARAEAAAFAGSLDGEGGALPLYARVLALQPNHAQALRGREDTLGAMLERARAQLREGDVAAAAAVIATARAYDPGHIDLPDTQARLSEELDTLRAGAEADLQAGRVERAVERWRRLLRLEADDVEAQAGLQRAAELHAARAIRLSADFRFADADAALAQAVALAPESEVVRDAQAHVTRSRGLQSRLVPALPTAERAERVATLLAQAAAAEQRGDLLSPPGESAYDRLRAAHALAPQDPAVRAATARLLPASRQCFERSLSANSLARAAGCLDASAVLGENDEALDRGRRRLALRWLAIGDERLGAGALESASAALASARSFDAATPGLGQFEERLRTARAVGHP